MKNKKFSTKVMAEVALLAAFAFVLDLLQGAICKFMPFWPNGGSVGIAMIPIIILAYRRGFLCGLLGGLMVGLMDLLDGVDFSPMADNVFKIMASVALDYILAWIVVGFAGLFSKKVRNSTTRTQICVWGSLGCILAGVLRYASVFLSGLLMWPNPNLDGDASLSINGAKVIYSLSYNGSYMIPTIVITVVLMVILLAYQAKVLVNNDHDFTVGKKEEVSEA